MKTSFFTICDFQDKLGEQLKEITLNATGKHVHRSRGAAMARARMELQKRGYDVKSARKLVSDAFDMAMLEMNAED